MNTLRTRAAVVAGTLGVCALFAACSSSPSSAGKSTTTTTRASTTTTAPSGGTTTTAPVKVPVYKPALNARKNVTLNSCVNFLGSWKATGNITNSADKARNYLIVVDYVTVPGSTVMDTKLVHVANVGAGKTVSWASVGGAGKPSLNCVIRFVQATPSS